MADAEHVVYNLKSLILGWVVHSGDVRDLSELSSRVVFEKAEDREDARRWNVDGQLVFPDREPGRVRMMEGNW